MKGNASAEKGERVANTALSNEIIEAIQYTGDNKKFFQK
jgi:hypothetical protein